jgi:hypothetical protein
MTDEKDIMEKQEHRPTWQLGLKEQVDIFIRKLMMIFHSIMHCPLKNSKVLPKDPATLHFVNEKESGKSQHFSFFKTGIIF